MNDYLVFATEQVAQTAANLIYANMVAAIPSPDLLDVTTGQAVPQAELDDTERADYDTANRRFPVFGINAATGVKNAEQGYTTAWAEPQQTSQGQWVFPKPSEELMLGVSGATTAQYSPEWFPPSDPLLNPQ